MFGISWTELFVILIIAIVVIPTRDWPNVAKFLAKCVKFVRDLIWKITDNIEHMREQIDLEKPITELSQKTMDDVMSAFTSPPTKRKPAKAKSSSPNKQSAKKKPKASK